MKNSILLVFSLMSFSISSVAQQKKAIINTPGVHCEICKNRIEAYLKRQDGIISATVDVKKKNTTVIWIADRTNIEEIKAHIANTGYDADDVTAEEFTYKRLPKQCQTKIAVDSLKQ